MTTICSISDSREALEGRAGEEAVGRGGEDPRRAVSLSASAAAQSVPAVSIMSSTMIAVLPSHVADDVAISATLCAGRSLSSTASAAPSLRAKCFASFTPAGVRRDDHELVAVEVAL